MADAPKTETPPRGAFIILDDAAMARHATMEEALSLAQKASSREPHRTFVVAQVVATVAPQIAPVVTFHRF